MHDTSAGTGDEQARTEVAPPRVDPSPDWEPTGRPAPPAEPAGGDPPCWEHLLDDDGRIGE